MINRQHKDRVFKFIFGKNKSWALSLFNAINDTDYTDPEAIEFNTIDEILYLGMHNDLSFLICCFMCIWEHQSTFNPNLSIRFFLHLAQLYEKFMKEHKIYRYGRKLIKLPTPKCVCFYNGTEEQPEEKILRLSDLFEAKGDVELEVRMLNINYEKNKAIMEACEPLKEYAWLVDRIRKGGSDIEAAVDKALDEMPDDFVIKKFLILNRAEVKGMFLTEYNEEEILRQERNESIQEGIKIGEKLGEKRGEKRGVQKEKERFVMGMLQKNLPLQLIEELSKLSEDVIRGIALKLGIAVVK